jgi:hypothetical protein
MYEFDSCCIIRYDDKDLAKVIEARTHLETTITILKRIIEPEENKLINTINNSYHSHDILEAYLENFLTILDEQFNKLRESMSRYEQDSLVAKINVKSFRERMIDYMYNLIVHPLVAASYDLKHYKGDLHPSITQRELFEYLLFRQFFIAAKIKGSEQRRKVAFSSSDGNVTFTETNILKKGKGKVDNPQMQIRTPPSLNEEDDFMDFPNFEEEQNDTTVAEVL